MKILLITLFILNTVFAFGECSAPSPLERAGVRIFLNPTNGTIYFSAKNLGINLFSVVIYDVTGKIIFTKEYNDGVEINTLNLNLNSGVYLMQLNDINSGETYKQKIIIEK